MMSGSKGHSKLRLNAFMCCCAISEYGYKTARNEDGSKIYVEPKNGRMSKLVLTHIAKKFGYKFNYGVQLYQTSRLNPDMFTIQLVLEYEGRGQP